MPSSVWQSHGNNLFSLYCEYKGKIFVSSYKIQFTVVTEVWIWHLGSWKEVGALQTHSLKVTLMEFSLMNRFKKRAFRGIAEHLSLEEVEIIKDMFTLMEIFYVDKQSQAWFPERLVDWLIDYDSLVTSVEDDPRYWDVMSSALSVGWLDILVKMLRLHESYQLDQLSYRELENGLVEAVVVLISKMPRLRHESTIGNLGDCFKSKPDFIKAWEKWRLHITKLDYSPFWIQCDNQQTREGLSNLLQVMLGNTKRLCTASCYWIELYVSHFLYMYNLAQKCIQLKPLTGNHKLTGLMLGILAENTEVVLAEISREFGPWMVAHAVELLTAGSHQVEILLHDERYNLRGIIMMELHRLAYAKVLTSHALM